MDQNNQLTLEFDKYLINHPELSKKIPKDALIVITVRSDKELTEKNIADLKKHHSKSNIVQAEKVRSHWTLRPLSLESA